MQLAQSASFGPRRYPHSHRATQTDIAELLCPIDDDTITKNESSLESAEIVREGLSCRTVIPVSTLSLSASSSISDHDVSVQVEVHNGDK